MDPTEHWAIMGASEGEATPRQSALAPSVPHLRLLRRSLSLSRLGRKRDLVTGRKVLQYLDYQKVVRFRAPNSHMLLPTPSSWWMLVVSDTAHLEFQGFLAEMQGLLGLCFGLWLWLLASLPETLLLW